MIKPKTTREELAEEIERWEWSKKMSPDWKRVFDGELGCRCVKDAKSLHEIIEGVEKIEPFNDSATSFNIGCSLGEEQMLEHIKSIIEESLK